MSTLKVPIGDVAEVLYGKALKADERVESGPIPVYGSNGVVGSHDKPFVTHPTLIIGRKGSVGAVTFAPDGGWPIDTTFYTKIKDPDRVDLRYLYHALSSVNLARHTIATSIPGVNRGDIYNTTIPLPPLAEQKRIAAILDKADHLRQLRRQAIRKLDDLLQSVFVEMFGDPISNPKDWPTLQLQDAVDAVIDCPHSTPKWTEQGKICLRTSNLTKGGWDWEDTRYISEEEFEHRTKRSKLYPGDIILSREGTVGIAAVVQPGMGLSMGQRLVQLRLGHKVESAYLLRVLLYLLQPSRISSTMAGSTSKHLNVADLRKLTLLLPPIDEQRQYSKIAQAINSMNESTLSSQSMISKLQESTTQLLF